MYNDKVCEISEVPKLLDGLLDCQYTPLGRTDLPRITNPNMVDIKQND
jgi:hypothetical protein